MSGRLVGEVLDHAPDDPTPPELLADHVLRFRAHILIDALREGTAACWERRATTFANVGTPTADATAQACRRHAWLIRDTGLDQTARAELVDITHAMTRQSAAP